MCVRSQQLAIEEGAEVVVDGRGGTLEGREGGFFLWPRTKVVTQRWPR